MTFLARPTSLSRQMGNLRPLFGGHTFGSSNASLGAAKPTERDGVRIF